jgi:hypothetical protein
MYADRRPILQLPWCLEYAERVTSVQHQLDTNAVCRELDIAPIEFA